MNAIRNILICGLCALSLYSYASGPDNNVVQSTPTKEQLITSIDSLKNILMDMELKMNIAIFRLYIADAEFYDKTIPTAAITVAMAKQNNTIKKLRDDFEKADDQLQVVLSKDNVYNELMNSQLWTTDQAAYDNVRFSIYNRLYDTSEEYRVARYLRDSTLNISNIEGLKAYVDMKELQGEFIDYQVVQNQHTNYLAHPVVRQMNSLIDVIRSVVSNKEAILYNM